MGESVEKDLIILTSKGLFCPEGGFYIDPWQDVETAVLTHAHGDHARIGSSRYIAERSSREILRARLGEEAKVETRSYGESFTLGNARVSLHSAGHILGSSQIRVEVGGRVWVVSGDYKRDPDPTCPPFEVVECDTFITEATFALPIYRWRPTSEVAGEIFAWWEKNRASGKNSVLCCYALGKAQRVLAELRAYTDRPIYLHGANLRLVEAYRKEGVELGETIAVSSLDKKEKLRGELILAPPSASGSPWMRRFEPYEVGFASGWMQVRGNKRREAYDRGFVVSDHADWPSLLRTIRETKARRVIATHGSSDVLARYVREEMGLQGDTFHTEYGDENETAAAVAAEKGVE
jgi:putative mRNA 3-end processing factor